MKTFDKILNGDKKPKKSGKNTLGKPSTSDLLPDMKSVLGLSGVKPKQKSTTMSNYNNMLAEVTGVSMSTAKSPKAKRIKGKSNKNTYMQDFIGMMPSGKKLKHNNPEQLTTLFIGGKSTKKSKKSKSSKPNYGMGQINPAKIIGVGNSSNKNTVANQKPSRTGQSPAQIMGVVGMGYIIGDKKTKTQKMFLQQTKFGSGLSHKRFADWDGDGVISGLDCQPLNPNKHGYFSKAVSFIRGKGWREPEQVKREEFEKEATAEVTGKKESIVEGEREKTGEKFDAEAKSKDAEQKKEVLEKLKRKTEEEKKQNLEEVNKQFAQRMQKEGVTAEDYGPKYQEAKEKLQDKQAKLKKLLDTKKEGAEPDPEQMKQLQNEVEQAREEKEKTQEQLHKNKQFKQDLAYERKKAASEYDTDLSKLDRSIGGTDAYKGQREQEKTAAEEALGELSKKKEQLDKAQEDMESERTPKYSLGKRAASKIGDVLMDRDSYRYEYVRDPKTGKIEYKTDDKGKPTDEPKTKKVASVSRGISRKLGYLFEDPEEREQLKKDDLQLDFKKAKSQLPQSFYQDVKGKYSGKDKDSEQFKRAVVNAYKEYMAKDKPIMDEQKKAQKQYAKVQQAQSAENLELFGQRRAERERMRRRQMLNFLSPNEFEQPQQQMQRNMFLQRPGIPDVTGETEKKQYYMMTGRKPDLFGEQIGGSGDMVPYNNYGAGMVNPYNPPQQYTIKRYQNPLENTPQPGPMKQPMSYLTGPKNLNEPLLNLPDKKYDPYAPKFVYRKKHGQMTRKTDRVTKDDNLKQNTVSRPSFEKAKGSKYPWTKPLTGYERYFVGRGKYVGAGAPKGGRSHKKLPAFGKVNKPKKKKFVKYVSTYGPDYIKN